MVVYTMLVDENHISSDFDIELIKKACGTLLPILEKTPVVESHLLSNENQSVYLKMEVLQRTGSFKVRGAFNKIANLSDEEKGRGIVASSAGNHAQGVAFAGGHFKVPVTICMPTVAPHAKVQNTKRLGAEVVLSGKVYDDAYTKARELQKEKGYTFIHPFDDDLVIAGQGTVGFEIMEQVEGLDAIVVPIGGGGLIAGLAIAAKSINPNIKIIGVQSAGAASMHLSLEKGEIVEVQPRTVADGIQVRRAGTRTFELCRKYVDLTVTVEEEDIYSAILFLIEKHHVISEGAGAVPVAAFLSGKIPTHYRKICLLVSGGNIDVSVISRIIERGLLTSGRRLHFETYVPDVVGELNKLTSTLAELNANVFQISQTRQKHNLGMMMQQVDCIVETVDQDDVRKIVAALKEKGYEIKEL
jgi:threonine dehydratase